MTQEPDEEQWAELIDAHQKNVKKKLGWLHLIAGLTLLNSILMVTEADWGLAFGLEICWILGTYSLIYQPEYGKIIAVIAMALNIGILIGLVKMVIKAQKGNVVLIADIPGLEA